ncbi:MAG: hypothetical protein RIC85_04130 [Gammaproteobacteria bacterium]
MRKIEYVYLKLVMSEIQHDALLNHARKLKLNRVKEFLNLVIRMETDRAVAKYLEQLSPEEKRKYEEAENDISDLDIDDEIPF